MARARIAIKITVIVWSVFLHSPFLADLLFAHCEIFAGSQLDRAVVDGIETLAQMSGGLDKKGTWHIGAKVFLKLDAPGWVCGVLKPSFFLKSNVFFVIIFFT